MEPAKQTEPANETKAKTENFPKGRRQLKALLEHRFEPALKLVDNDTLRTLLVAQEYRSELHNYSVWDTRQYEDKNCSITQSEFVSRLEREGPAVLEKLVGHLKQLAEEELASFRAAPDTSGFVKLWFRSQMISGVAEGLFGLKRQIKDNKFNVVVYMNSEAEPQLKALSEDIINELASSSNWDDFIGVLAITDPNAVSNYFGYRFEKYLKAALRLSAYREDERAFVKKLKRVSSFLSNLIGFTYADQYDIYKIDGDLVIRDIIGDLLAPETRWIFHNSTTRECLSPFILEAVKDYLRDSTAPDIEHLKVARIVENLVVYSHEPLRKEALSAWNYGSLRRLCLSQHPTEVSAASVKAAVAMLHDYATRFFNYVRDHRMDHRSDIRSALDQEASSGPWNESVESELGELLQRIFHRQSDKCLTIARQYLQGADENQRTVWETFVGGRYTNLYRALEQLRIDQNVVEQYVLSVGSGGSTEFLHELGAKVSRSELNHLVSISVGNELALTRIAKELEPRSSFYDSNLTSEEILSARAPKELLRKLAENYSRELADTARDVLSSLNNYSLDSIGEEQIAYIGQITALAPQAIEQTSSALFLRDVELSKEEWPKILRSKKFLPYLSGKADLEMKLSPTEECEVVVSRPLDDVLRIFPNGLFEPIKTQTSPSNLSAVEKRALTMIRKKVRGFILETAKEKLEAPKDAAIEDVEWTMRADIDLQEKVWLQLMSFDQGQLGSKLQSFGLQPLTAMIKVLPKSDPVNWLMTPERSGLVNSSVGLLKVSFQGEVSYVRLTAASDNESVILSHMPGSLYDQMYTQLGEATIGFLTAYINGQVAPLTPSQRAPGNYKRLLLGPVYSTAEFKETYRVQEPVITPDGQQLKIRSDYSQFVLYE